MIWPIRLNYVLKFVLHCFYGFMSVFTRLKLHSVLFLYENFFDICLDIDGAYFGTTFPHLFLMTYGHLKPQKAIQSYVPRVFGFKLHKPWHGDAKICLRSPMVDSFYFASFVCLTATTLNKQGEGAQQTILERSQLDSNGSV